MLIGASGCAVGAAVTILAVATRPSWISFAIAVLLVPVLLLAFHRLSTLFRYPCEYSVEVTARGIGQPAAAGSPSLAWNEVTRMTPSVWGGFSLSDDAGTRKIRVWDEVRGFVQLLDIVLDRGSISPPVLPLVVSRPRGPAMLSIASGVIVLSLVGWLLVRRGPTLLFWLALTALVWIFYDEWRKRSRALSRVEIVPEAVTLSNRAGNTTIVPLDSVASVRLVARDGLSVLLIRRDGNMIVLPTPGASESLSVYHALHLWCSSRRAEEFSDESTTEFAASRRRQLVGIIVAALIGGLSIGAARSCIGKSRPRRPE